MIAAPHSGPESGFADPIERRGTERMDASLPPWLGMRAGSPEELAKLREALAFDAAQLAKLRKRNEQLMGVNSDLRCKLGEMTLRWVDCRYSR